MGTPCPRGCGGEYAGAAGQRGNGGPSPSQLPAPAQLRPSPQAAKEKTESPP